MVQQLCRQSGEFSLQTHQRLLKTLYRKKRVLLYHGIGSGKTCTAITVAAAFHQRFPRKKIYVVVPASLRGNFTKEVQGPCGQHGRVTLDAFELMSYQGFTKAYKAGTIDLNNSLLIVDEIQNVLSLTGDMYKTFLSAFHSGADFSAIVLTATPMFDRATEIALLGNLLRSEHEPELPTHPFSFRMLMRDSPESLHAFFKDKVSYYRGANPMAYPTKVEHTVECPMSPFQERVYMKSIGHTNLEAANNPFERAFLITPRQSSNFVLPSGTVGKLGTIDARFDVRKHSTKFEKCVQGIRSHPGPAFVYSNFVSVAGIDDFVKILRDVYRFQGVRKNQVPTTPGLRYAVFRADDPTENNRIVRLFNTPENKDGSLIKVIIGSPAMKEGVSLLRVRSVHILDPYWNRSRTEQIMGRAVRFCSHADLPENERRVDVFHYYAVPSDPKLSVDLRILDMSNHKIRDIRAVETILQETAFDCGKLRRFNEPPTKHCFRHDLMEEEEYLALLNKINAFHSFVKRSSHATEANNNAASGSGSLNNNSNNENNENAAGPSRPSKPLEFAGTGGGAQAAKKRKPASSCPSKRRPIAGICPADFPYSRLNAKGDLCCFKRGPAGTTTKAATKTCPPEKILNPKTKRCVSRTSRIGRTLTRNST